MRREYQIINLQVGYTVFLISYIPYFCHLTFVTCVIEVQERIIATGFHAMCEENITKKHLIEVCRSKPHH